MTHILKLIKLSYPKINDISKSGQPIKFQEIFSIKESDEKELNNMTLALDYIGSDRVKN